MSSLKVYEDMSALVLRVSLFIYIRNLVVTKKAIAHEAGAIRTGNLFPEPFYPENLTLKIIISTRPIARMCSNLISKFCVIPLLLETVPECEVSIHRQD